MHFLSQGKPDLECNIVPSSRSTSASDDEFCDTYRSDASFALRYLFYNAQQSDNNTEYKNNADYENYVTALHYSV